MKIIEQILILIFKLLVSLIKFLTELTKMAVTGIPKKKEGYNAYFESPSLVLSRNNKGFCLTGRKNLTIKTSYQNSLIIGGTGVGKSSVVLIPSIYSMEGSFVINDPSGELFTKSAGYLAIKGYQIRVINFTDPERSSCYNPLIRANSSSDIQKVASMLIENTLGGRSKDPFWNSQATNLLSMLITILKSQPVEYQNLYNIRQLLNRLGGEPKSVDKLFSKHADDVLFAEYKSFVAYDEKVVSGIIATCKAALQIFTDDAVASVTSTDNIDLQEFRDKPTVLYIRNSVADQKYYAVLTSLFFEQFFSFVLSRFPNQMEKDIFLLIDEASSLNLPTLPLAVANVRKHRAGIMLLLQDFNQLVHLYGKHEADGIKANCFAKLYFTGTSLETAKELEQTLGQFQYEDKKKRTVVRPLMTNDEIRTMKATRALLVCGHHRPIIARLRPYYRNRLYRGFATIEHPEMIGNPSENEIAILPINETKDEIQEE